MTTSVLQAFSQSRTSGLLSRMFSEFEAFFEEQGAALHRAHRDCPFGL